MSDSRSSTGRRPNGQGSYFRRRGSWYVQVTGSDGTRSKPIKFPGDWTEEQVAAKTARLAALALEATTGRTVGPLETTAAWFGRWFDDRAARGIVTAELERGRFAKWAPSALRSKPIVEVTTADLETFVEALDKAARAHADEAEGSPVDHASSSWVRGEHLGHRPSGLR